ncbi:MAG: glycine cleavage system aminomethyltransferase GcvT, partial [Deltaproteobacteria bacterium]|nr:glycine cleavage system aminomethyltransferase GcvT [Deltaproteobacteria bacterium]
MQDLKRTPLYEDHQKLGAKLVEFAGWELPVRYSGVVEEHHTVRRAAGLFDICHMGEIRVSGPEAEAALNYLSCNNVTALSDGRAQYSAILNPEGGVVDDIIIYRLAKERYLVCVNAANAAKDFAWFCSHNRFNASFVDASAGTGLLALQGPAAQEVLRAYAPALDLSGLKYFHCKEVVLEGLPAMVARTGYTGEDGFELYVPWEEVAELWRSLLKVGESFGLKPIGLGARDSLRLEACYSLYGHELREDRSALESGLGWIVKFSKGDFIGREALLKEHASGPKRKSVGFFVE